MKILIVGAPNGGQKRAVETLLGRKVDVVDWEGAMFDHKFDAKYFTANAGLWVDQFPAVGAEEWANQFASNEAKEVRDVLCMVIYTFDKLDRGIEPFVEKLRDEDWKGTLVALPTGQLDKESEDFMDKLGITVIEADELLDVTHTALFDWLDEAEEDPAPDQDVKEIEHALTEPLLPIDELDTIMSKLKMARDDPEMSREAKMKLAEQLADQLIP